MNTKHLAIAGPYTHENLSIFLLLGADALDGQRFIPLDDALEQKCVTVHETGNVGQLEVENLSEHFDLYIQAGDVVKGGRQDRTLGVDFVLPAKSGRVPIPSFCVESGRWHRRAAEEAGSFSSSKSYLSSKKLRMAAKMSKSQGEVWDHVAETQANLSESLGKSLFAKLWSKLLDAAVLEAIAESHRNVRKGEQSVTADSIRDWFNEASQGAIFDRRGVPPRVVVSTRRAERGVEFATFDHRLDEALLHQNFVAN